MTCKPLLPTFWITPLNIPEPNLRYPCGSKPQRRNKAEIYIKDSGPGIPRADLKRIFKRFYRVPNLPATATKGTGLGLAIVRSIIERHRGRVGAESRGEGTGSTFFIRLPRV